MPVIAESAAPAVFDWKRWPETDAFVDELIATALDGNAFAAEPGGADAARDRHAVQGLGRSPGGSRRPGICRSPARRWATSASRSTYAVGRAGLRSSRRDLSPDRSRARRDATPTERAGFAVPEVAIKVEWVAAFSRAHDLGLEIVGLSDGPIPGRPGCRASGRRWPWSSGAAIWVSSRFPASWRARAG